MEPVKKNESSKELIKRRKEIQKKRKPEVNKNVQLTMTTVYHKDIFF